MAPGSNWSRRAVVATAGGALFGGCVGAPGRPTAPGDSEDGPTWRAPADVPATTVEANPLVERLEIPWDISVAPDGDVFVSERVGRIVRFTARGIEEVLSPESAIDAQALPAGADERPWWVEGGEGGTLGVAVHPDYPDRPSVYVYYTASAPGGTVNRVSRFDVSADEPSATERVLIDDIPAGKVHNGGRIEFGPEGYLWVLTGTAAFDNDDESRRAGDPGSTAGKVLRVTPDGEPAPGNPTLGADADPRVYTYGHRNPQGIGWLPDGTAVVTEHGGSGHDEINRLVAGADYGWPNAPRGRETYRGNDEVRPPLANTGEETWAPSGCVFYTGEAIPSWSNRLLVGSLARQAVVVVTVTPPGGELPPVGEAGWRFVADWYDDAYAATAHLVLSDELGRIRHLAQGLDGELYAITSNRDGRATGPFPRQRDDRLVRLESA